MTDQQMGRLERLAKLKQDGLLTEEEFTVQKKKVLGVPEEPSASTVTESIPVLEEKPVSAQKTPLEGVPLPPKKTPVTQKTTPQNEQSASKPRSKKSLVLTFLFAAIMLFLGYAFFVINNEERSRAEMRRQQEENSPQALRRKLADEEETYTSKYLNIVDKKWSGGGLFDPANVMVVLRNTATLTTYKDIRLEVFWYSETSTQLRACLKSHYLSNRRSKSRIMASSTKA